jgi:hypothetical protein
VGGGGIGGNNWKVEEERMIKRKGYKRKGG